MRIEVLESDFHKLKQVAKKYDYTVKDPVKTSNGLTIKAELVANTQYYQNPLTNLLGDLRKYVIPFWAEKFYSPSGEKTTINFITFESYASGGKRRWNQFYLSDRNPSLDKLEQLLHKPHQLIEFIKQHRRSITPDPWEEQEANVKLFKMCKLMEDN